VVRTDPRVGRVAFENVSFGYGDSDAPVLSDVSFVAEPGQTIAILGATGSGKSSLVNLIPRFYDVTSGRVTLDGEDVQSIPQDVLRRDVGIALQESFLFSGTIRDNIAYGKPDLSDEEVGEAALAAQADEFVRLLPDAYNSPVEQRGANFSGGQRQRLAIARALAPKPKVDPLAKILEKDKEDLVKPAKPNFDRNAIAKFINQTKASADPAPTGATALGLPDAHAERLSPSLAAAIDGWLKDAYDSCWAPPPTLPEGERYVAEVTVEFNPDGSLAAAPQLVNPPSDPAWRAHAESALRAVLKCNPLRVPPEFAPYFQQWRSKTIHFDPENAMG